MACHDNYVHVAIWANDDDDDAVLEGRSNFYRNHRDDRDELLTVQLVQVMFHSLNVFHYQVLVDQHNHSNIKLSLISQGNPTMINVHLASGLPPHMLFVTFLPMLPFDIPRLSDGIVLFLESHVISNLPH
jgi:hypothetical protein